MLVLAATIAATCRTRDVGLSARDGNILVSPHSALTPELRATLTQHKPALLRLLGPFKASTAHALVAETLALINKDWRPGVHHFDAKAFAAFDRELVEAIKTADVHRVIAACVRYQGQALAQRAAA